MKYRTEPEGNCRRIFAVKEFGCVKNGERGGLIECEDNLSHEGEAWIFHDAIVSGQARVYGEATVYGGARVSGGARVYGEARVSGQARVYGEATVFGEATVYGGAIVSKSLFSGTGLFNWTNLPNGLVIGCELSTLEEWEAKIEKLKTIYDLKWVALLEALIPALKIDRERITG